MSVPFDESLLQLLSIEQVIDRHPLLITPDDSAQAAVDLMGRAYSSEPLPSAAMPNQSSTISKIRATCVLVMAKDKLVGIITVRDIIRLVVAQAELKYLKVEDVMTQPVITMTRCDTEDVFVALLLLRQHRIRHLPVLSRKGNLVGLVTPETIRQVFKLNPILRSQAITESLLSPAAEVSPATPLLSAAHQLVDANSSCAIVKDEQGHLQGILTEEEIIQTQVLEVNLAKTPVQSVLNEDCSPLSVKESLFSVHQEMLKRRLWQLPICNEAVEVVGVITLNNLLKALAPTRLYTLLQKLQHNVEKLEAQTHHQQRNTTLEKQVEQYVSKLKKQSDRDRLIATLTMRIRHSLELTEILNTVVTEVRQLLSCDRVVIYRFEPDGGGTIDYESADANWPSILGQRIFDSYFARLYAQPYQEGRVQAEGDIYTAGLTQCHIDLLAQFQIRAVLAVPILQGNYLWGLLCAHHCAEPKPWQEDEIELLRRLSAQVAIAIQQAQLYQKAQVELSERRRAEKQIKMALEQKKLLLKEIHHRVKNNLQIVSSLLTLQSRYVQEPQVLTILQQSQNRIRAMALIHERLYQSNDLGQINFTRYLRSLCTDLLAFSDHRQIALQINTDAVYLNLTTATPCGLILNEVMTNAIKHAFVDRSSGSIEVEMKQIATGFRLSVSDDGVGLPENVDVKSAKSLGLRLVRSLSRQLGGTVALKSSQAGTVFSLDFIELDSHNGTSALLNNG